MSDIAIRIDGLGKMYRIGERQESYRTFRDAITDAVYAPVRRAANLLRGQAYGAAGLHEAIWVLKDISLEVKHGEVIGIIGRNGAGKSTLLKILSRITEPSKGFIELHGRIGALLEVGTGFHPELTGRENIYLNGAILGMLREEINRKFDEIVQFAEVEKFIDTPVKHYSSGMLLRLGFSVAAHLEPDILVVDEVLAVGDASFQKKCLGKMGKVAQEGRTVLFVSHNMPAVANLCQRGYCLNQGNLVDEGDAISVIHRYLSQQKSEQTLDFDQHPRRKTGSTPIMQRIRLMRDGAENTTFKTLGNMVFEIDCEAEPHMLREMSLGFLINDSLDQKTCGSNMHQYGLLAPNRTGMVTIRASIDQLCLSPGSYSLSLYLGNGTNDIDVIEDAVYFDIVWEPVAHIETPPHPSWGASFLPVKWQF